SAALLPPTTFRGQPQPPATGRAVRALRPRRRAARPTPTAVAHRRPSRPVPFPSLSRGPCAPPAGKGTSPAATIQVRGGGRVSGPGAGPPPGRLPTRLPLDPIARRPA